MNKVSTGYHFSIGVALASAFVGGSAIAQEARERGYERAALELTMILIPANAQTPDAVTKTIELPKDDGSGAYVPSAQGVEHSAQGLETANAAREDGRAFGQATAAAARDNRENASRASRDADTPPRQPTPAETPDRPASPQRP
jgi:hypothetical protein